MTQIALLLALAALAHGAARLANLPTTPLLVTAGLGAAAAGWITPAGVQEVVFLSLAVLLFAAGTELSPERLGAQRGPALRVGVVQFVAVGAAGLGTALLLGHGTVPALHLAVAVACSSTLVGIRLLQRRRALFEPFGRLVAGVLLIQDLAVALALPLLGLPAGGDGAPLLSLVATGALVAGAYVLSRTLPAVVGGAMEEDPEMALLGFLSLLFVFVGGGRALGVPDVTAAFLAGFSLSGFPIGPVARHQLASLTAFFGALFFTALGAYLVVPSAEVLAQGILLAALVIVITPVVVSLQAEREGLTARTGLTAGFLLAQTSEFSLVVGLQGTVTGLLPRDAFTALAVATVVTMALTPLLTDERFIERLIRLHPFRKPPGPPPSLQDHVVVLGCGSNGAAVLDLLLTEAVPVAVVEEDPAVVLRLVPAGIPAVRGDAADPEALRAAGVANARAVVSTLPWPRDAETALALAGDVPVLVRVFEADEEAWVRARGGTPVSYAEAAADDFFEWFREGVRTSAGPDA